MAFTEPNLHSRNLKFISILFIAYWALGLKPSTDKIQLLFINYQISNPDALAWFSHAILFYFAWRFYLNSKGRVKNGIVSTINTSYFQRDSMGGFFYDAIEKTAKDDYEKNHKSTFQQERERNALEHGIDLHSHIDARLGLVKINYDNGKLNLHYQVSHYEHRLPGNDFKDFSVPWTGSYSHLFMARKFITFLTSKEDMPDFMMPWVLFVFAVCSRIPVLIEKLAERFGC